MLGVDARMGDGGAAVEEEGGWEEECGRGVGGGAGERGGIVVVVRITQQPEGDEIKETCRTVIGLL